MLYYMLLYAVTSTLAIEPSNTINSSTLHTSIMISIHAYILVYIVQSIKVIVNINIWIENFFSHITYV